MNGFLIAQVQIAEWASWIWSWPIPSFSFSANHHLVPMKWKVPIPPSGLVTTPL